MIRALPIIVALGVVAGTAVASPTPMVTPPAGWHADPERGSALATKLGALQHFGGAAASVAVEAYAPSAGTIALVVTRVSADKLPGSRDQAVRAALDELGARDGTFDEATKQLRAARTRTDQGLVLDAQLVIAADAEHVVAVTGECLDASTDPALAAACAAALRTLDTGVPLAQRVTLAPAHAGTPPPEVEPARGADTHAQFRDGTRVVLPPMAIAQDKPAVDRRPIYIGAGLVVLAMVFYWNRRRRDRFDREDAPDDHRDDDGDDLHAAARGDAKDDDA